MTPPTVAAKGIAVTKVRLEMDGQNVKTSIADGRRMLAVGTVPEEALVEKIQGLGMPSTGLLPANILWVSSTGRQVIFERPPRRVTVTYTPSTVHEIENGEGDEPITLSLPMPWTVYAAVFDRDYQVRNLKLYAAPSQITEVTQYLYYLPLPNLYEDCRFCLPDYGYEEDDEDFCCEVAEEGEDCDCDIENPYDIHTPQTQNLSSAIMSAYQKVWSSNFNHDLMEAACVAGTHGQPAVLFPHGPTYMPGDQMKEMMLRWEKLSLQQIAGATWRPITSVVHVIQQLQAANQQNFSGYYVATTVNSFVQQLKAQGQ
jgi:hypothetical protein